MTGPGSILTLGLGFDVKYLPTLGYGSSASATVVEWLIRARRRMRR